MAIELCSSDESSIMSPRISFSHDISQTDYVPVEQYIRSTSPSSSIDFDFCVFRESFDFESSSADELFFDGKILPIEIKRRISPTPLRKDYHETDGGLNSSDTARTTALSRKKEILEPQPMPPPPAPCKNNDTSNNILENKAVVLDSKDEKQSSSKSFWSFKRSNSLNCGSGYARTLCPLPLLSRSNSTGSTQSVKRNSSSSKDNLSHKQHSSRPFPSKSISFNNGHYQKPPLKKGNGNYPYSNNGVRFNSVLNVPPASLFGLSSFFSSGKEKNKKK